MGRLPKRLRLAGCVFAEDEAERAADDRDDARTNSNRWSGNGYAESHWSRSSGGPSSAACGLPSNLACSCRDGGPSSCCDKPCSSLRRNPWSSSCAAVRLRSALRRRLDAAAGRALCHRHRPCRGTMRRRNLAGLSGLAGVLEGDLYAPLPTSLLGRVDLLLANAPVCSDWLNRADAARSPPVRAPGRVGWRLGWA